MARISQEVKEETRASIIKASLELFTQQGYEKTNTKAIAKQCKIAEGTIFNYFESKDHILMAVFSELSKEETEERLDPSVNPLDLLIDILMVPLKQLDRLPKPFVIDIVIAAMKLTRSKKSLLESLMAFDRSYVKKVEEKMQTFLNFDTYDMDAKLLSELFYTTLAADYMAYLFDKRMTFDAFELASRKKLKILTQPYL